MNTTYQTLIVKFSEPITALDGIFDDTGAWGTDTLKGWIDDYCIFRRIPVQHFR